MKIFVNAQPFDITAATLEAALDELGFASSATATALNGQFVAHEKRQETPLAEGDRLEVLAPMQGG